MSDLAALRLISREQQNLIGAITGRAIYEGTISVRSAVDFLRGAG
jgi:phosphoribosylformimino-5-aminoimidazole carboxamide ribonucleotide (ProFAR) isomerase